MDTKYCLYFHIVLFCLFSFKHAVYAEKPLTWAGVKQTIRKEFPEVPCISTQELFDNLSNSDTIKPVLLDARASEEFTVSHIQDAYNAENKKSALMILENMLKDTLIVVYCSVGYRSAAMVKELMAEGYTNIYNLEGSVFEWANNGWPVYTAKNKLVKSVHPYDKRWGALLKKELRATNKKK